MLPNSVFLPVVFRCAWSDQLDRCTDVTFRHFWPQHTSEAIESVACLWQVCGVSDTDRWSSGITFACWLSIYTSFVNPWIGCMNCDIIYYNLLQYSTILVSEQRNRNKKTFKFLWSCRSECGGFWSWKTTIFDDNRPASNNVMWMVRLKF